MESRGEVESLENQMNPQLLYAAMAGDIVGIIVWLVEGYFQHNTAIVRLLHSVTAALITLTIILAFLVSGVVNLTSQNGTTQKWVAPYETEPYIEVCKL